ncbi:hypothetical protein J4Q44_G00265310 [Coregonus suidteri]|uniref:Uncharacterized protein n=1 Tax=Coregonus suidteri TaxID=861788 RepID=A0AAN8LJT3_9TELE
MCSRRCPRAVAAPRAKLLCVVSSCTGRIKIIQPSEFQLWQCPNYVTCRLVSSSRPPELCMWMRCTTCACEFVDGLLPRKALASPVREPPLTELEDDFLILEDYEPPWFSHRWKFDPIRTTAKPRPKQQNQSHSSDNASADILTKATANQRSGGTDRPRTTKEKKGKNPTTRKERDSSPPGVGPQGDGPVNHVDLEADDIEQEKKKVNNLLSEPTTAGDKVNPKTSRGRGRQSGKTRRLSGRAGEEPVTMEEESEAAADHQLKTRRQTRMFLQFYSWHQQDRDESSLRFQPIVRPRRSAPPLLVRLTPPS